MTTNSQTPDATSVTTETTVKKTSTDRTAVFEGFPLEATEPQYRSPSSAATFIGVLIGIVLGMLIGLYIVNPIFTAILPVHPTFSQFLVVIGCIVLCPSLIVMMIRRRQTNAYYKTTTHDS